MKTATASGTRFRESLKRSEFNQTKLAEKLNVHYTSVYQWTKKGVPPHRVNNIAKLIEVEPETIVRKKYSRKPFVLPTTATVIELKPEPRPVNVKLLADIVSRNLSIEQECALQFLINSFKESNA